jgi:HEPN domain-containing protein
MEKEEKFIEFAHSYKNRASVKRDEAKNHKVNWHYPESISASQECMEFSLKAIFYYFDISPRKEHEFSDEEFENLIKKIPKDLEYLNFPRLLAISQFWGRFHIVAKYGKEKLGIGPEKIFKEKEAELALSHAEECLYAATIVQSLIFTGRRFLIN